MASNTEPHGIKQPPPFTGDHLDSDINAEHTLRGKQRQHNTAPQITKTHPGAKAQPQSKCCSQPKVSSGQVRLSGESSLFFSRSTKSHSFSPLRTMKTASLIPHSARVPEPCRSSPPTQLQSGGSTAGGRALLYRRHPFTFCLPGEHFVKQKTSYPTRLG